MYRITLFIFVCLLTPTACTGPTIQCDVYTWGYKNGQADYLTWKQCDYKNCEDVETCILNQREAEAITYGSSSYDYDSLYFDIDCWTNECPDAMYTHIYN